MRRRKHQTSNLQYQRMPSTQRANAVVRLQQVVRGRSAVQDFRLHGRRTSGSVLPVRGNGAEGREGVQHGTVRVVGVLVAVDSVLVVVRSRFEDQDEDLRQRRGRRRRMPGRELRVRHVHPRRLSILGRMERVGTVRQDLRRRNPRAHQVVRERRAGRGRVQGSDG